MGCHLSFAGKGEASIRGHPIIRDQLEMVAHDMLHERGKGGWKAEQGWMEAKGSAGLLKALQPFTDLGAFLVWYHGGEFWESSRLSAEAKSSLSQRVLCRG